MPSHADLIDRAEMVLLVIDVQERLAAVMERRGDVVAAATRLVRAFAVFGAPIVVTRQYPNGLGGTVPELEAVLADARADVPVTVFDKTAFCACEEPGFADVLDTTGRRQVVVVGMETHICVAQTALALVATGHRVHVVEDACCSRRGRDHETALARLRAQRATVTCSESVIYEAAVRAGTDEFRRLLAVVKDG